MGTEMRYKGEQMNRLEVVKKVFTEFVLGNGRDLLGRSNDLIGIISFARYPDTTCPLTLAHGALTPFIESIKLVKTRAEDGTAIGDALALAAARLKTADETTSLQKKMGIEPYKIKSKVIILLSDGENNSGRHDPIQAAEIAAKWGVKIYTIAIGGDEAVTSIQTPFGVYKVPMRQGIDTGMLEAVAKKTGGFFKMAEDDESLREIYKEIDRMEKTEVESVKFVNYKEAFIPFIIAVLFLTGLEIFLTATIFRKIP
jgi:Ca-activated chloride channel family protein